MQKLEGARRIGIMGGTFDPPHKGHFHVAAQVADAKKLDRVLFVPAPQPWQKSHYSDPEDRFAMTALGASGDERFVVSRIELDRPGPTYTIDTIEQLSQLFPDAQLWLILGADAALNFDTWYRTEDLLRCTKIIAVPRPGFNLAELSRLKHPQLVEVVEVTPLDISATEIRAAVREGRSIDGLVPPAVAGYIASHRLYSDDPPAV